MSCDFYPGNNSNYFVTGSVCNDYDSGIRFWKLVKAKENKKHSKKEEEVKDSWASVNEPVVF